jgi:hypothetical protein
MIPPGADSGQDADNLSGVIRLRTILLEVAKWLQSTAE